MLKELVILVKDSLTGLQTHTRMMVDFSKIAHVQEDLNLNTLLLDELGSILFVTIESYDVVCEYLKQSRSAQNGKVTDNCLIA